MAATVGWEALAHLWMSLTGDTADGVFVVVSCSESPLTQSAVQLKKSNHNSKNAHFLTYLEQFCGMRPFQLYVQRL